MKSLAFLVAVAVQVLLISGVSAQTTPQPSAPPPSFVELGQAPRLTARLPSAPLPQVKVPDLALPSLSVNTSIRRASRNFYNAIYPASEGIPSDWTGSVPSGIAGTTSLNFKDATILRVNYFRAMGGVPAAIALNSTYSANDQLAALMMSANNELDHYPPSTWIDYTAGGALAARNSNLAYAFGSDISAGFGPGAITAYIQDSGSNNLETGHRRWVLYPPTQNMGTGDVDPPPNTNPGTNALWIMDTTSPYPALRDGFVSWPPKGYVPYELFFPRWSFSLLNANFSAATVKVTLNGTTLPTTIESSTDDGYGDNTLVWYLNSTPDGSAPASAPASDQTYTVTVGNVLVNGVAQSFTYPVTVFDPSVPGPDDIFPAPTGPATVSAGSTTNYTFTALPEASGYNFLTAAQKNVTWVEGAETGLASSHVTAQTTGTYSPVTATTSSSGTSCFQLCQDGFNNQDLLLNSQFVASANSSISFQSRYGYMTPDQFTEVQVSLDNGQNWTTVFSRAGTGADSGAFAPQSVSLAAYANRLILVRFQLEFINGNGATAYTQTNPATGANPGFYFGWLIDNITPTNITEISSEKQSSVTASPAAYVAPANVGSTQVLALAPVLFGSFPLEYGPVKSVSITAASTVPVISSAKTATGAIGKAFTYQIVASNSPKSYKATGLPSGLTLNTTTGAITGKPANAGVSTVTLSATNASGTGTALLTLTVPKLAQTITFPAIPAKTTKSPAFRLSATASSGLPVSYQVISGPATVSGSIVTLTGTAGKVTVKAYQHGNTNYNAATSVLQSFTVLATPTTTL